MSGGAGDDTLSGGGGQDLLTFGRFGGNDTVTDFEMKNIGGKTTDQLDVSDLTDGHGNPLKWSDVQVDNDGAGNAVLRFPEGEAITLIGVDPGMINKHVAHQMGMPCFAAGTLIATPQGRRRVEDLGAGDLVTTPRGPQPVVWAGGRQIGARELAARPALQPVVIRRGALGNDQPLIVSRQHGLAIEGRAGPVLVRAAQLAQLATARQAVAISGPLGSTTATRVVGRTPARCSTATNCSTVATTW